MDKYLSRKTMNIEEKRPTKALRLPMVTICSKDPYKQPGFFFNETSFEENAFKFEEIFGNGSRQALTDKVDLSFKPQKNFCAQSVFFSCAGIEDRRGRLPGARSLLHPDLKLRVLERRLSRHSLPP